MLLSRHIAAALLVVLLAAAFADRNPCHDGRFVTGKDVSCEVFSIPPKLCKKCRINPFLAGGNFKDCAAIYDLDDAGCQKQLKKYASLNSCDKQRVEQVKDISANKVKLDYFVYSICEECCDCIPRGSLPGEFKVRKKAGTLLKTDRANCPLHAHYDICRVWPEVRYVKTPSESVPSDFDDLSKYPKMCPIFRTWKFGPNGQNLYNKDEAIIPDSVRKFLDRFVKAAKCKNKNAWNDCIALEKAQNRV